MSLFVEALVSTARSQVGTHARGLTTGEPEQPQRHTWGGVHDRATVAAATLRAGPTPVDAGDAVAVLATNPGLVAPAVQAVWLTGGSVTMLHQPTARSDLAQWARDTVRMLRMIGAHTVLIGPPFDELSTVLRNNGVTVREIGSLFDGVHGRLPEPVEVGEDATALLQLTSGSTADPKAVRITHHNLLANIRAMEEVARIEPERDVMVSWLPLFHDMGMVGCLTVPMTVGLETVKVTPADFMARPMLWLELITRHAGTITAAPNFAYAILGRRMSMMDDGAFDLSRLRFALNGAEPIDAEAVRTFTDSAARFGMRPEAMVCAFGMAEATLGVSFTEVGVGMRVDTVDADVLETERRAVPASGSDVRRRELVLLGKALSGLEIEAVDNDGVRLGEREVGQLRIRGDSVSPGYLTMDGPVPTHDEDGWLSTGDDGYLTGGEVVICGRRKDVIIIAGRNLYPRDIERAACEVDGVRAGNAAAVRLEAGSRRERFGVVAESRSAGDAAAEAVLRRAIAAKVFDAVGIRPASVLILPPGGLPKTPSGKLQRAATAKLLRRD